MPFPLADGESLIPGAPGWAGVSMLTAVLAWLLGSHLPAKDKQLKELMADHNAHVREMTADFRASLVELAARADAADRERRADVKEALAQITAGRKEALAELTALSASFRDLAGEARLRVVRPEGRDPS